MPRDVGFALGFLLNQFEEVFFNIGDISSLLSGLSQFDVRTTTFEVLLLVHPLGDQFIVGHCGSDTTLNWLIVSRENQR